MCVVRHVRQSLCRCGICLWISIGCVHKLGGQTSTSGTAICHRPLEGAQWWTAHGGLNTECGWYIGHCNSAAGHQGGAVLNGSRGGTTLSADGQGLPLSPGLACQPEGRLNMSWWSRAECAPTQEPRIGLVTCVNCQHLSWEGDNLTSSADMLWEEWRNWWWISRDPLEWNELFSLPLVNEM